MTTEELKNAAGFKAVDAEGNELGVVSLSDIVSAVKQELQPSGVARASVSALSEVSAQAATDTYEDQLPQKTDVTWIRGLDESGNPILISKQSLVSVLEGLIGISIEKKEDADGITDLNDFKKDFGYAIFRNVAHKPKNASALGVLSVRLNNVGWFSQIGIGSDVLYIRAYNSGEKIWSDWLKSTLTEHGTQE